MIVVLFMSIYALLESGSYLCSNSYIEYHSYLDSMSCLSSSVTLSSPLAPIKGVLEDAGTGTELKVLARVARPRDELTTEGGIYLKKSAREIWRSQTIYQSVGRYGALSSWWCMHYLSCSYLYPKARNSTTRFAPAALPSSLSLVLSESSPLKPATGVLAGAEGMTGLSVLEREARHPARLR